MADHYQPPKTMTKADYEKFIEKHGYPPTWPPHEGTRSGQQKDTRSE